LKKLFLISISCFVWGIAFSQKDSVEFILVDTVTNQAGEYYMASNVNSWNPHDEQYKFKRDNDGTLFLICYFNKGTNLQFKFTRGSWLTVETSTKGTDIINRSLKTDTSRFVVNYISGWKDQFTPVFKQHTASPHVKIIDTAFFIPQLNRTRKIWIYLPGDYTTSGKKYPVLYMHDGQNLFDEFSSAYGEWGVDECLDSLIAKGKPPCIVVGIENGPNRITEYNPYNNERFGKEEGVAYVDFIVQTLKPFIDKNYKTITGNESTLIAGSSLGALISYYAILKYPAVFGKAGIFSPAFWIAPEIKMLTDSLGKNVRGKLFFYMGGMEGQLNIDIMNAIAQQLGTISGSMIYTITDSNSRHNENAWRNWFAEFYNWIMADGYNYVIKTEE